MAKQPEAAEINQLRAVASRRRQNILSAMLDHERISPSELALELNEPLSNLSYHIRVLRDCNAIVLIETSPVRGSLQHFYAVASDFAEIPWVATLLESLRAPGSGEG